MGRWQGKHAEPGCPESKSPACAGPENLNGTSALHQVPESVYEIAAIAVAPNKVAPTVAVISDTSANAINSFITVVLVDTHLHMRRPMRPGYSRPGL